MRAGFSTPDFDTPVDIDHYLRLVPDGATVKGMMLQSTLDHLAQTGHPPPDGFGKYLGFKDYPGEEFVRVLAAAGERAAHGRPLGHGLRTLGRLAYPTLRDTLIGRTMFSIFSSDIKKIIPLASRAYGVSASTGSAEIIEQSDREAVIRLVDIFSFLEHYHFGVLEGVLTACDLSGEVGFAPDDTPTSGRFWVHWDA
jgi:uncharacterized protein (TIGR02265 family)